MCVYLLHQPNGEARLLECMSRFRLPEIEDAKPEQLAGLFEALRSAASD